MLLASRLLSVLLCARAAAEGDGTSDPRLRILEAEVQTLREELKAQAHEIALLRGRPREDEPQQVASPQPYLRMLEEEPPQMRRRGGALRIGNCFLTAFQGEDVFETNCTLRAPNMQPSSMTIGGCTLSVAEGMLTSNCALQTAPAPSPPPQPPPTIPPPSTPPVTPPPSTCLGTARYWKFVADGQESGGSTGSQTAIQQIMMFDRAGNNLVPAATVDGITAGSPQGSAENTKGSGGEYYSNNGWLSLSVDLGDSKEVVEIRVLDDYHGYQWAHAMDRLTIVHSDDSPPAFGSAEKHLTEAGTQVQHLTCDGKASLRDMLGNQHHASGNYNWCGAKDAGEVDRSTFVLDGVDGQPTNIYSKYVEDRGSGSECWYRFRHATT